MAEEDVRENLSRNIIPLLPMLKEAKSILNSALLETLKKVKLSAENTKIALELADSALEVNKKFIELARENGWKLGDAIAYSLILNLRIVYTIDCLKAGKVCKKSQLVSLAKKISGSGNAYEGYLRVKDGKKRMDELFVSEAERLYDYVSSRVKRLKNG